MTAAAVKRPGGEALLGRAVAPEGKHARHSPSRAAGRDPVETARLGSIITLMRIGSQTFIAWMGLMARGNGRSALFHLALVEDATIDGLALMEWANALLGKARVCLIP
jgi:hypothetical protein